MMSIQHAFIAFVSWVVSQKKMVGICDNYLQLPEIHDQAGNLEGVE